MKNRLKYLDYAKGFAIILMLFAHTMTKENYIHRWIFAFHMPIFFIISGIILNRKFGGVTTLYDLVILLKKRIFQLGVPYFVWGLLLILFYTSLEIISHSPINAINSFWKLVSLRGIDSLWFFPFLASQQL